MKRTRGVVVAAVILAVLASACGSSKSTAEHVTVLPTAAAMRAAATATASEGTAHVEFTMSMSLDGHDLTLRGTGGVDQANRRAVLTFDMKDLMKLLPEQAIPPEMASALDEGMTVMLDGTVMYMRFPLLSGLPGGKEWFKVDLAQQDPDLSSLLGASGGTGAFGSDPSSLLQFLQGADDVTEVGKEEVRGEQTTHFSGSYTFNDAIEGAPESMRDQLEKAVDDLGMPESARDAEIPFDVWIGDDGIVRRMSMAFDFSKLVGTKDIPANAGEMEMTIEFFDFGTAIDFDPPSEDEVVDMSSVLGTQSNFTN